MCPGNCCQLRSGEKDTTKELLVANSCVTDVTPLLFGLHKKWAVVARQHCVSYHRRMAASDICVVENKGVIKVNLRVVTWTTKASKLKPLNYR